MAMLPGNVIEVKAYQTFLSQVLLNVFHYEVVDTEDGADLEDVASVFNGFWTTKVAPIQSSACTLTTIEVSDLSNGVDIWTQGASVAGTNGVDPLPSVVALAYRFNRATALTRHGQKRFGGIPEAGIVGNTLAASFATVVPALATAMFAGLSRESGVGDFHLRPVIIGRVLNAKGTYELDLSRINDVASVQFVRVTSQATRRAGRGS